MACELPAHSRALSHVPGPALSPYGAWNLLQPSFSPG